MRAAVLRSYNSPLEIAEVEPPRLVSSEGVILRVASAGVCHSDLHLIDGKLQSMPIKLPLIPGHENCGRISEVGRDVPRDRFQEGDMVIVFGGWGCGMCASCREGEEHLCPSGNWPGLSHYNGGFAQLMYVPSYRFLINVTKLHQRPEEIAPLADAALTPYRAVKKGSGGLGEKKLIAIIGIGGLGSYAVQFAKLLNPACRVVAVDTNTAKLNFAQNKLGAEYALRSSNEVDGTSLRSDFQEKTGNSSADLVIDCVGSEESINQTAVRLLGKKSTLVILGLHGADSIRVPILSLVSGEYRILGSSWGSYNDLRKVIELSTELIHSVHTFPLEAVNDALDQLREGNILGRAVLQL